MNLGIVMKWRNDLIENGKRVARENPDELDKDQLIALSARIFEEINAIDTQIFGFPRHDTGTQRPKSISKEEEKILYNEFIDWYDLIKTPNTHMYEYVLRNYPRSEYQKVLCVGDGENCHLGRKLAMQGYEVISIDPLARKEFSGVGMSQDGKGVLTVVKDKFFDSSKGLIDWADLVVGVKVPLCVPYLINLPKPTVFSISANPEIYHMRFRGVPIVSAEQYRNLIKACPGIRTFMPPLTEGVTEIDDWMMFIRDGKQKERLHE